MKAPPRYSEKYAKDPSVQGNMSVEDIIKRDWERNYKGKSGITLEDLENIIRRHMAEGGEIYRLRNTLFLASPESEEDYTTVKFHSLTGDLLEVYLYTLLTFVISMGHTHGTQEIYSYTEDKTMYRRVHRLLGDFVDIEDMKDDPSADARYKIVLDLEGYMRMLYTNAEQQGG